MPKKGQKQNYKSPETKWASIKNLTQPKGDQSKSHVIGVKVRKDVQSDFKKIECWQDKLRVAIAQLIKDDNNEKIKQMQRSPKPDKRAIALLRKRNAEMDADIEELEEAIQERSVES